MICVMIGSRARSLFLDPLDPCVYCNKNLTWQFSWIHDQVPSKKTCLTTLQMVSEHYLCSHWIQWDLVYFNNIYHENSTILRKPWAFRRMFRMDSADAWVAKATNGQLPCYETTALPWAPCLENVRKRTAAWCTVMRCLAGRVGGGFAL